MSIGVFLVFYQDLSIAGMVIGIKFWFIPSTPKMVIIRDILKRVAKSDVSACTPSQPRTK